MLLNLKIVVSSRFTNTIDMKNRTLLIMILMAAVINLAAQSPILKNPVVEKIGSGFNFVEGPVWVENLGLLFSDIPANKVYLLNTDSVVSTYINPSGKSNGLALNADGKLIMCQHYERQIGKYENNSIVALASHYNGKRLNSPNDLTIHSKGTVFFTDPPFGLNDEGGTSDLGYAGIYSLTSDGKVHLLDKTLKLPNGIALSPDEKKLYVIDSEIADIYVWDIVNDSTLANKTLFYNMPTQWGDGMKTDENGFLYVTAANGLTIFSQDGKLIENIKIGPSNASNCGWGSEKGEPTMYVTAGNSVYRLRNKPIETGYKIEPDHLKKIWINVYPNPSSGNVSIALNNLDNKEFDVFIYTSNGNLVAAFPHKNFSSGNKISFPNPAPGTYLIKIQQEYEVFSQIFYCFSGF
jgi:gluconolactonase